MKRLPNTENVLVLRTDFSDDSVWESIRAAIEAPVGEFHFQANVDFLSDPEYANLAQDDLPLILPIPEPIFIFVVDQKTISDPEHPILVIDLFDEPGRSFRAIPSTIQAIENNLSIANMDFDEFADFTDPDGVYRCC